MTEQDKGKGEEPGVWRGFLFRFKDVAVAEPRAPLRNILINASGAGLAILAVGVIGDLAHEPLLLAPLGATALLLFAVSDGVMSQPRNVLLGHLIGVFLGVAFAHLLGPGWLAATFAVALSVFFMLLARAIHAPAGSTAIVASIYEHDWLFIAMPVLISVVIVLIVALIFNNLVPGRRYPTRWF